MTDVAQPGTTQLILGADISAWQRHFDLAKTATERAFIGIKAAEGLGTSRLFAEQWNAAEGTSLLQFAYAFLRWERDNAAAQAKHMRDVVGPWEPGLLPPACDLEWLKDDAGNYIHLPAKTIALRARQFCEGLADGFGVLPQLYLPVPFWHDYLCVSGKPVPEALGLTKFLLWAAAGFDKKAPAPMVGAPDWRWTFRQIGKGPVAGITDSMGHPVDVDLNVYAGTLDELRALARVPA